MPRPRAIPGTETGQQASFSLHRNTDSKLERIRRPPRRHPRRFFPSFRCANHRPPGSAHTVQPRRHENTSPTGKPDYGEKREGGIFRPPPAVSPSASIQSCTVLLPYPNIFQLVDSDTEKGCAILNRIDSIWHSLLRSFIRRTVKTPASARRTRISTAYKA